MKILVTGASGFIGKNLSAALENNGHEVMRFDVDQSDETLAEMCKIADFVFHFAGVNRPESKSEFRSGNVLTVQNMIRHLEECGNSCPVMLSSSTQAVLRNPYGESKLESEKLIFEHGKKANSKVLVYRFVGVFGKWSRPNYNTVVATFCHNIARNLPITINDPNRELELLYIDDLTSEMLRALEGKESRGEDGFCIAGETHKITLGRLSDLIQSFKESRINLTVPNLGDPFTRKLYATYLSFLPENDFSYPLKMNTDTRGNFTEMLRTFGNGQFSVNISKPGITKGNHWHDTKNEKFVVVSGSGVIRLRPATGGDITEIFVNGENIRVVDIPPGYTHNIENLGKDNLVTFMWCSECFDPEKPDTNFLEV